MPEHCLLGTLNALMCCEIWLPWQVMEEVSVWSGRSYHLAGEMLHICYSDYSFLIAVNLRVLCSSTGKWQTEFTGVEDTTAVKGGYIVLYCCLKAYKGIPCLCCSVHVWCIWGARRVSEHQSCLTQAFFVTCHHAASSCPKTKRHSSKVIVVFMDPLWAIIHECFLYSPLLWLPYCC